MDDYKWKPSEILSRYQSGERNFREIELEDPAPYVTEGDRFVSVDEPKSFHDAVLDGADFSAAFIACDFRRASLRHCKFANANVKTCVFDNADLAHADFSGAAIDAATFQSAFFDHTNFTGATAHSHVMLVGELPM